MNHKIRILVVDDHRSTVLIISKFLSMQGYEVIQAFDGFAGLKAAQENLPDLIILDSLMPGMNGYEVCSRLYNDSLTAGIPVLILVAENSADKSGSRTMQGTRKRIRGYQAGSIDVLAKPVTVTGLLSLVEKCLWLSGSQIS